MDICEKSSEKCFITLKKILKPTKKLKQKNTKMGCKHVSDLKTAKWLSTEKKSIYLLNNFIINCLISSVCVKFHRKFLQIDSEPRLHWECLCRILITLMVTLQRYKQIKNPGQCLITVHSKWLWGFGESGKENNLLLCENNNLKMKYAWFCVYWWFIWTAL